MSNAEQLAGQPRLESTLPGRTWIKTPKPAESWVLYHEPVDAYWGVVGKRQSGQWTAALNLPAATDFAARDQAMQWVEQEINKVVFEAAAKDGERIVGLPKVKAI